MKFETYNYEIVKNYQKKFRKDSCTHQHARSVNVRAHILSLRNARAYVYAWCARVCARIFTKNLLIILYYPMNISFKFHKDRSFCCRDICKTVLTFKSHHFSMYFPYLHTYTHQKSSKMENY